ncbi:MAG: hypothetical protein KG003_15425 [Bacteroidetes bacterium]|nr:hypothetical protein [Bacteroidota bacterium]
MLLLNHFFGNTKSVIFCILFSFFFIHNSVAYSNTDTTKNRKYYVSADFQTQGKNNNFGDSFYYGNFTWQSDFGILFRNQKVLRLFAAIGLGFHDYAVDPRFFDSVSRSYKPTRIPTISVQPKIGFDLKPGANWFLRVGLQIPVSLYQKVKSPAFAEKVHIIENGKLRTNSVDFRLAFDVGRNIYHQRLFVYGSLHLGTRPIFTFPTSDNSHMLILGLGFRYMF